MAGLKPLSNRLSTLLELGRTVKVSDPENWYGESAVHVSFGITSWWNDRVRIRVSVLSIDDFGVYYDYVCDDKLEDEIVEMYAYIRDSVYGKIPDTISLRWLYDNGFYED